MITITHFLIIGLGILLFLSVLLCVSVDINGRKDLFRWVYYILYIVLAFGGILMAKNYIYPQDSTVFKNTDYHILEHKGFKTDSVFYLVHGSFPDNSLWDSKSGEIKLSLDSIYLSDYCEPFYVEQPVDRNIDSLTHHKGNSFTLVNKYYNHDIINDGLIIAKNQGAVVDTLYRLEIATIDEDILYISSSSKQRPDTSQFKRAINKGYPLSDIVAQNRNFEVSEELQDILNGVWLVREEIPIKDNLGLESSAKNKSALLLCPGANLYYSDNIMVNGETIDNKTIQIPYAANSMFYSGLGRNKTDVFRLTPNREEKTLDIRYVLPKMQKLKDEGGRLFITSLVDNITIDSKDGGYFYNEFESDNNFNHINGEIRYTSGSALEDMQFEIMDVFSSNPSEKINVKANDGKSLNEFELSVKAKRYNTKWIFDVKDLRASNPLGYNHIFIFIILFTFFVGIRILFDTIFRSHSLSFIELSSYVVVICLCVVRLIIGWRSSTFAPIDEITPSVFSKMRGSSFLTTCITLLLPTSFIIISVWQNIKLCIKPIWDKLARFFTKIGKSFEPIVQYAQSKLNALSIWLNKCKPVRFILKNYQEIENKNVVSLFLLSLILCYVCAQGPLERLLNIPVPLILYLLFDLFLIKREYEKEINVIFTRILLAVIAFAYLFIQDAGFTVIFLVFLYLYHVVFGLVIEGKNNKVCSVLFGERLWNNLTRNNNFYIYLLSVLSLVPLVLFLMNEGDLMIFIFNNISYIIIGVGVLLLLLSLIKRCNKLVKITGILLGVVFMVLGTVDVLPNMPNYISDAVNSKSHMKYRAEIQKLSNDQCIDELMETCDFKSTDITFIMRSAHNQWFINQYLNAGSANTSYFKIQPHSNQGSSYTTQTTDLVITRYVLAEHPKDVVILFMILFSMLICIYIFEVKITDKRNGVGLSALLLLFTISFMVFLSATNRIVFVGQDFPFISIQSRVAVIFPIMLLFIAIFTITKDKLSFVTSYDSSKYVNERKWATLLLIGFFAVFSVLYIAPKGKDQNEHQFDVSQIIQELSDKVEILDKSFVKYQKNAKNTNGLSKDSLWSNFVNDAEYSQILHENLNDNSVSNRFYSSLLDYFSTRQVDKNNPEELLHMRKRNEYWHLSINKKHFFIPSKLEEVLQWKGDLLAAETERLFLFNTADNRTNRRFVSEDNFITNILPQSIINQVENVSVAQFDSTWGCTGEPLILINSSQSKGSKQLFNIESANATIKGSKSDHQIATRIKEGDYVMINKLDKNGEEQEILGWRYGRDNENYLAKNIWMNGYQRLFYPLGKESMWSYQFANVVSSAFGKNEMYRDSTLRISIDYDLHKKFYDILSSQNKTKLSLKLSTIQQLQDFAALKYNEMQNRENHTNFYFDVDTEKVMYKKSITNDIIRALTRINNLIAKGDDDIEMELQISNAIDVAIQRKFDFSAVVLDGNGRIRLLFDHTHSRNVDPNNIKHFNKFVSDMYRYGDNQSERDVFGNKALQILPSGPGSSFKPIAYTSITSQEKIGWETLNVLTDYRELAKSKPKSDSKSNPENTMYDYYGGVHVAELDQPLSIDGNSGLQHNNYLIKSNNLYHSVVILLGLQQHGQLENVFKVAGTGEMAFPVMSYKGQRVSFNPNVWFPYNDLHVENGIMNDGLYYNFRLQGDLVRSENRYTNYYGNSKVFNYLFENESTNKVWTYPETGSQNIYDRKLSPKLRNGFNQMLLGAYPLEVTPLQMADMGMRLATLNSSEHLTTLDDSQVDAPEYTFFNVPTWQDNEEFFKFYQRQVLSQLRQVPQEGGTASALRSLSNSLRQKGYYMYAKTGTLNDGRTGASINSRMKHLLVIVANTPLEEVASIEELQRVKYYVMYLSYIGINKEGFTTANFKKMIEAVTSSELFINYMEEN